MSHKGQHYGEFDSPIEVWLMESLEKHLDPAVLVEQQVQVHTIRGMFRVDFMFSKHGRRLVVECDGRKFHDESKDHWRDALILGDNQADLIWRFRGTDLYRCADDCLFIVSTRDPWIFSERGIVNLRLLASDRAKRYAEMFTAGEVGSGEMIMVDGLLTARRRIRGDLEMKSMYEFAANNSVVAGR